jgi:hypothetical protein
MRFTLMVSPAPLGCCIVLPPPLHDGGKVAARQVPLGTQREVLVLAARRPAQPAGWEKKFKIFWKLPWKGVQG